MADEFPKELHFSEILKGKPRISVITGSGIDAEAGLPTFNGENGHYQDEEASYLASIDALRNDPQKTWKWFLDNFVRYHDTKPAKSHYSLSELEERLGTSFIGLITQNISGLHLKAGNKRIHEIHGSIRDMRNTENGILTSIPYSWVNNLPNGIEFTK